MGYLGGVGGEVLGVRLEVGFFFGGIGELLMVLE